MFDEEQDVNEDSSTQEQEVNTEVDDTTTETSEQETTEALKTQQQTQGQGEAYDAVDEFGVPWKNRALEKERKLHELTENFPNMIEEALAKRKPETQKYTIAQLEQIASENPQYRPWVEEEKAKILQSNMLKVWEEKSKQSEQARQSETLKKQAYEWAVKHPRLQECFVTDNAGNKTWNHSSPLTQMIGRYMQDKDLRGRPDSLIVASKLALADYLDFQNTKSTTQNQQLQNKLKKVQKQTMVEGGGKSDVVTQTEYQKALSNLKKSGHKRDAQAAVMAYLNSKNAVDE